MFGYLEHLIKTRNKVQLQALLKLMEGSLEELVLVGGYPQMTIEDFYETTREEVEQAASGDLPVEELLQHFRDYSTTNAIVMFLRLITATSLKKHADHFTPFLDNGLNISQFCRSEVEPMAREADHCQIEALSRGMGVAVGIEYLDLSSGTSCKWHLFSTSDSDPSSNPPPFTLLYRPGHYDLLYSPSA